MKGLTTRQKEVLEYIGQYQTQRGFPPAVRDIARHFNLVSAAGVHKHIKALVRKGFLAKENFLSRSIRVIGAHGPADARQTVEIPLLGYVAAGQPIEAVTQDHETVSIPGDLLANPEGLYALRVKGESMIEDYVCDGDFVVMEPRDSATNGEMVVALINGQEATLKRFYREGDHVRLQPANPTMQPIVIRDAEVRIQGVVVALWRNFRSQA